MDDPLRVTPKGAYRPDVPKRRVGGDSSQYWRHYTPELVNIVEEMCFADIQAFGYDRPQLA